MLEPKARRRHHLRGFAEIGDDCVVRTVYGENAKAGNRNDQAYRCGSQEGAPIRPPVGYVIAGSSHGRPPRWLNLSVGLIATAPLRRLDTSSQSRKSVQPCRIKGKRR